MAKELCPICGQAVKGVFKTHIKDKQTICKDCALKMNLEATMIPLMSVDDVKKHLEYREENRRILDGLQPTQKVNIGMFKILADMNKNYWYLDKSDKNGNFPVFRFDEIAEFHLDEDGETITKGGLGGAVVGGILAGGVGAIVGSTVGKKSKTEVTSMVVHVSLSNPYFTHFDFQLIPMGTSYKKGSMTYNGLKHQATTLVSLFDSMCKKVETESQNTLSQQPTQPQGSSVADEILKFKNLLDCGAITAEEFEAKKKQLLGV